MNPTLEQSLALTMSLRSELGGQFTEKVIFIQMRKCFFLKHLWTWVSGHELFFLLWFIEVIEFCCYLFYLRKYKSQLLQCGNPWTIFCQKLRKGTLLPLYSLHTTIRKKRKRKEDSRLWPNRFLQNTKVRLCQMSTWKPRPQSTIWTRSSQGLFELFLIERTQ